MKERPGPQAYDAPGQIWNRVLGEDDPVDPGDNPGEPADTPWVEVELPSDLPDGTPTGIALCNNSSAAVGVAEGGNGILLEISSQGWREVERGLLASTFVFDVAIDAFGRRVMAGATIAGRSVEGAVLI